MNNDGKNVAASSSLFGHSGTATPPQWNHTTNFVSRSNPQVQYPGHFQLSQPQQSQLLAQAQFAQARAQLQSQVALARLQSQAQIVENLHNANASMANVMSTPPATGSSRRAAQKPPSRFSGSSSTNQSLRASADGGKKREFLEKQIPEKVAALLPESALYTQLLDFEALMDDELARRKMDVQEAIRCPPHVQKTLRMYVFNTFSKRTKMDCGNESAEESSWSLKITGRILEDGKDTVPGNLQRSSPPCPKFSAFFKKVTICLDQSLYPENHVIVWDSALSPKQHDGFEVRRKGDKEFTAVIRLEMNYSPEKYMVSTELFKLLGVQVETRPKILAALWHYVKSRNLQSRDDPSFFMCDPSLRRLFGEEKIKFTVAAQKLLPHLSKPQPIQLEHNIKLSGYCPGGTTCYDVLVDVPFPLENEVSAFLASTESPKEMEALDEVICASLKKIQEHRRRRASFLNFSQSPAEYVNTSIASQSKALKLVARDASRNTVKEQRSEFYNKPW